MFNASLISIMDLLMFTDDDRMYRTVSFCGKMIARQQIYNGV